jgi:hypothetical protein
MSERTSDRRTEQVGPEYQFLGTAEHDCLAALPAGAPEQSWPTADAFPKYAVLGTVEHDCLSGPPADAPERSWPVAEWGTGGGSPEVIRRDLSKLYKALNEYHIARGGGRLTIEGFKELIQSAIGVEV